MTLFHSIPLAHKSSPRTIRALHLFYITCILLSLWGCGSNQIKETGGKGHSSGISSLSESQLSRYNEAITALKAENPKEAEKLLKKLVTAKPDVVEIWLNLAFSQYQQKQFTAAQKTANELLKIDPSTAQAYNLLGLISVVNGSFSEAEKQYRTAIQLNANYANALYNMALLQDIYLQNVASAITYYNQYLQIEVNDQQTKDWVEHLKSNLSGAS